jgi:hypothetical protein
VAPAATQAADAGLGRFETAVVGSAGGTVFWGVVWVHPLMSRMDTSTTKITAIAGPLCPERGDVVILSGIICSVNKIPLSEKKLALILMAYPFLTVNDLNCR